MMKRFHWKLVCGLSVVAAIVIGSLLYRSQVSSEVKNVQTNTIETNNNEAPKTTQNNPSPTDIKENPKVVEDKQITTTENKLIITEKDYGQYFTSQKGQQVFLRLSNNFSWVESEPITTGAIVLSRVNHKTNSSYREWQVNFPTPSTATIESNISTGTLGTDAEVTKFFVTLKSG